jgi:hypothetical protein
MTRHTRFHVLNKKEQRTVHADNVEYHQWLEKSKYTIQRVK